MTTQEVVNLFIGLAGVLATLSGAILAWRKWKPSRTNIQVTTADTLVDIAVEAAGIVKVQRDELRTDVDTLKRRLDEALVSLDECSGVIRRERERSERAAVEAERERFALLARIDHLEAEVAALRASNTEHFPNNHKQDPGFPV